MLTKQSSEWSVFFVLKYLRLLFKMAAPLLKVFETDAEVAEKLCSFVISKANAAIQESGTFTVGLSGTS